MPYKTDAVVNYFLELANIDGEAISPMKLQKLLYLAHGWSLALADKPLLDKEIQAWKYGPVIPSVYQTFKEFGNDDITIRASGFSYEDGKFVTLYPELPDGIEHQWVRDLLKKVWEIYKPLTAAQLSTLSHLPGSPWSQTVGDNLGQIPSGRVIPDTIIKKYFLSLIDEKNE